MTLVACICDPQSPGQNSVLKVAQGCGPMAAMSTVQKAVAKSKAKPAVSDAEALAMVMEMMAIPGPQRRGSGHHGFHSRQVDRGRRAGERDLTFDDAHRRTPLGGQVGNLVLKLPGTIRGPRRMLSAHVDTVPICVGSRPVRKGKYVVSAEQENGPGRRRPIRGGHPADNRASISCVRSCRIRR